MNAAFKGKLGDLDRALLEMHVANLKAEVDRLTNKLDVLAKQYAHLFMTLQSLANRKDPIAELAKKALDEDERIRRETP